MVFQSVAHDAVFDTDDYILFIYAPTGFLVTPVPDNPNKCKLTFVSQVVDIINNFYYFSLVLFLILMNVNNFIDLF